MSRGFLDDSVLKKISGAGQAVIKAAAPVKIVDCATCGRAMNANTPYFPIWGQGAKKVLLVLPAPTKHEDVAKHPFAGTLGSTLRIIIEKELGINFEQDFFITYGVKCQSTTPVAALNVNACRHKIMKEIETVAPRVIIPFGYWATVSVIAGTAGKNVEKSSTAWAGEHIPDQKLKRWVCPTFETALTAADQQWPNKQAISYIVSHIRQALALINIPFPIEEYEKKIITLSDERQVIFLLNDLRCGVHGDMLSFDLETTGLSPYREGHSIHTASFSNGDHGWAFPMFNHSKEFLDAFKAVLTKPEIKLIAHNGKFDYMWVRECLGYWPTALYDDTMILAHTAHNQKPVGLKYLAYAKLGVEDYDSHIDMYKKSSPLEEDLSGVNSFNRIAEAPLEEMLRYNALDTLYTFFLWKAQLKSLTKNELWAGRFLTEASLSLAKCERFGMRIDDAIGQATDDKLTMKIARLLSMIQKEARATGWNEMNEFQPSNNTDIAKMFFNILGFKPTKQTAKGGASTDKESLEAINHDLAQLVLNHKKLTKIKDTFLKGIIREGVNGFLHPAFLVTSVDSYRTSSRNPNFQNFPKRDKEAYSVVRGLLHPHLGHKLMEVDYSGIEVATNAMITQDPNLIKYVTDQSTDMHRDTGEDIFLYERGQLPKEDRQVAKNSYVFPTFYGSTSFNTAPSLWGRCSEQTKKHLLSKGIASLDDFAPIVERAESIFWTERFPVFKQWKDRTWQELLRTGYITAPMGFRYYGLVDKKQLCNYPAQGGACHILLWTFIQVQNEIEKRGLKSGLMGQIHDSIVVSVHPDEEDLICKLIWYYGTIKIRQVFPWVIVPLKIDKSITNVDESWDKVQEVGLLTYNNETIEKELF